MKFKGINFSDECKVVIIVNGQDNQLNPPKQKSLQVINNVVDITKLVAKVSSDAALALMTWRTQMLQNNTNKKLIDKITIKDVSVVEVKVSVEDNLIVIGYQFTNEMTHYIQHKITGGRISNNAETVMNQ